MTRDVPSIVTRVAHWGWHDHRYHGHRVFAELLGHETFGGLTALSVCGRRLSPECCAVLDDAAVALTLADPRIWPLKLTRLVASYGSSVAGAAAGLTMLEGAQIGPWTTGSAALVLIELRQLIGDRTSEEAFVRETAHAYVKDRKFLWGFGTPYRAADERLVAFRRSLELRGRHRLPYFAMLEAVARALRELRGWEVNIGAGFAAACLDMGIEADEVPPLTTSLMQHMFFSNAVEGARQSSEQLRTLPDELVSYRGARSRVSPRAANQVVPTLPSETQSARVGAARAVGEGRT